MGGRSSGAILEGPDILDFIGPHQRQRGVVDVLFDSWKRGG